MKKARMKMWLAAATVAVMTVGVQAQSFTLTGTQEKDVTTHYGLGYLYDFSLVRILTYNGNVGWLYAYNNSTVTISGGRVTWLNAYNSSTVNISGGSVSDFHAYLHSDSEDRIIITGGSIGNLTAGISLVGNEHFSLTTDLTPSDLTGYGVQTVDGTIGNLLLVTNACDTSTVDIIGGSVKNLYARDSSRVNIIGGTVSYLDSYNSSTVDICGGRIDEIWTGRWSKSFATITIVGENFELGIGLWLIGNELFGTSTLLGQWFDGASWTTEIMQNDDTATILLIPKPASLSFSLVDFAVLASEWKKSNCVEPSWCDGADLDKGGSVDIFDLHIFVENWLEGVSP